MCCDFTILTCLELKPTKLTDRWLYVYLYKCVTENYFSYFSTKTYVVGTQKNRLDF